MRQGPTKWVTAKKLSVPMRNVLLMLTVTLDRWRRYAPSFNGVL
jgi:hypothetical protein